MIQTATTTMATTLRASIEGLDIVDKARCKKDWAKIDEAWVDLATTSKATLRRFWAGTPIQSQVFKDICQATEIDNWESIADLAPADADKKKDTVGTATTKKRWIIELDADLEEIDPQTLHAVITQLSQMVNPNLRLVDIDEGSIKLLFEGSQEDFERIQDLFQSKQVTEVLDIPIKDIHITEKTELVQWLQKNGGSALQLSEANLRGADLLSAELRGANLSGADLREADLAFASLSEANLRGTDLRGVSLSEANLYRANLHRAILSGANLSAAGLSAASLIGASLREANLREADLYRTNLSAADLRKANLREANLREANLRGANLGGANLREANLGGADLREAIVKKTRFGSGIGLSEQERQDLRERGAIFDDESRL